MSNTALTYKSPDSSLTATNMQQLFNNYNGVEGSFDEEGKRIDEGILMSNE